MIAHCRVKTVNLFSGKRSQVSHYKTLRFNETPRLWAGFPMTDEQLSRACYEDFLAHGLDELIRTELACDGGDCDGQRFVIYPPTAINNWEGYDLLTCVFPACGQPIIRMVDELTKPQQERYRCLMNACLKAFETEAAIRGHRFERLFWLQHVSPYQSATFKNSYPHLHSHTFAFSDQARCQGPPHRAALRTFYRHNLFFDPFTDVYAELFAHDLGMPLQIDLRTHSILLDVSRMEHGISTGEMDLVARVSRAWKERWWQLARCFCELPRQESFLVHECPVFDKPAIVHNLNALFQGELGFLSQEARAKLLEFVAIMSRPRDWTDARQSWKNVMNGPYGSIGVVFDCERGEQQLRVAPRTFGSTRTGATDGTWLTLKHRRFEMPPADRDRILNTQKRLVSLLSPAR